MHTVRSGLLDPLRQREGGGLTVVTGIVVGEDDEFADIWGHDPLRHDRGVDYRPARHAEERRGREAVSMPSAIPSTPECSVKRIADPGGTFPGMRRRGSSSGGLGAGQGQICSVNVDRFSVRADDHRDHCGMKARNVRIVAKPRRRFGYRPEMRPAGPRPGDTARLDRRSPPVRLHARRDSYRGAYRHRSDSLDGRKGTGRSASRSRPPPP